MIFPGDFSEIRIKPSLKISWVLLFLNIFFFLMTTAFFDVWPSDGIRRQLGDEKFKKSVVEMYQQTLDPLEQKLLPEDTDQVYGQALKDQKFWGRIADYPFAGDKIQIEDNRKVISAFQKSYLGSSQYQFGLSSFEISPWSWITYQFVHASLLHLLGNMLVVFLMAAYLEKSVSGFWIGLTYLFSGFAGGVAFLLFDKVGTMAVVGASASASGLLSFLLATQGHRLMPWFYAIAPIKNGYGKIYLPVFFIFPVFLVSDFVSMLWEPNGVSANVAVSAHVGGTLMGMLLGLYYLLIVRSKAASHRIFSYDDGFHELP